jgi:5-methylcytosine-specific restriction endonuclease McrA
LIDFSEFKSRLLSLFENAHYFDNHLLKQYFEEYELLCDLPTYSTVEKFAQMYFHSWKKETHEAWLKSHKELRAAKRQGASPKPKTIKKIKKFSPKRAAIEREYEKSKAEIMEERPHICAGCKRGDTMISFSHRIPRSERSNLISEKSNIDLLCFDCANKVETFRWDELINGQEIAMYIKSNCPERYWIYFYKNKAV